jgi:di/tricarboxylate transporter
LLLNKFLLKFRKLTTQQTILFTVLFLSLVFFAAGRWRYDAVALFALLAVAVAGIVPGREVFLGFGHPAVITVAAVFVVSRGLMNSGLVDSIARAMNSVGEAPTLQVLALTAFVTLCSAFMNNVGALALLMPVAIRMARNHHRSPSYLLMPLAFGSLLGGMTTLIGTPPNIIIATFRHQTAGIPFRMFDFTPVGFGIALGGVLFISLIGWRLIPQRKGLTSREDIFKIQDYISEVRVPEQSKVLGKPLYELENMTQDDVTVVGLVRGNWRVAVPSRYEFLRTGDILVVEAGPEALKSLLETAQLELAARKESLKDVLDSDEVNLVEAVVMPDSMIEGRTALALRLRWRYGVNVLGVARQGVRVQERLGNIRFKVGDILLLEGQTDAMQAALPVLGCLPLAERGLRLGKPRRVALGVGIFGAALIIAAFGLLPVQISFSGAAAAMVVVKLISLREAYESIDWPILVLLGAMIPVGQALESTGGAKLIANTLIGISGGIPPEMAIGLLLITTMLLSNVINNAAAAILMAPIAITVAQHFLAFSDPFLMAVAVGSSAAFLTPIGHQSNTLVMGPGGYRFGDYWRMGLPISVIVAAAGVSLIIWFWPLVPPPLGK